MKNSIATVLAAYGFQPRANGSMYWGRGSLVWGDSFRVAPIAANLYEVRVRHWFYDPDGEPVQDTEEARVLRGAEALAWVCAEAPRAFWR